MLNTTKGKAKKRKLERALKEVPGSWKDADHPELVETGTSAWVREMREEAEKRLGIVILERSEESQGRVARRSTMFNLMDDEVARKIQASDLPGVWAHDLRVPEGMLGLKLVDEKLDVVAASGLLRVDSGWAQFFGVGKKNAVVLARAHELPLDFSVAQVLTRDPVFVDFNCQLVVRLQPGAEALFLKNTLAGRSRITLSDLREWLGGEVKEVAQSYLGKRGIAELADHLEIKPELEAEIEINLKRSLSSSGLAFLRLRTTDFHCDAWKERKEAAVLISAEQAKLEGKKRLQEVFTQNDLADLAGETSKVEMHERRVQLWDRMRRAAQSDKMNEVRSEKDFDDFLREIDKDKLLKESEMEEFKRNLRDKLQDGERARGHLVRMVELKSDYEYKNQELSLRSGYTQAQQQAEAELQTRQLEAELRQLDIKLALQRKTNDVTQAKLDLESREADIRRSRELSDVEHRIKVGDMQREQEARGRAQGALEKAEADRRDLEARVERQRQEIDWLRTLDTLDDKTKMLVADTPQKVEFLAGLAKIKAQSSLSTEQLLAMAVAAGNSSQAADVLKTLVTKASTLEDSKDIFERRVSEQKQARDDMRAMSENFIKAQQDLFNKTLETLAQIAKDKKDKGEGEAGVGAVVR